MRRFRAATVLTFTQRAASRLLSRVEVKQLLKPTQQVAGTITFDNNRALAAGAARGAFLGVRLGVRLASTSVYSRSPQRPFLGVG